MQQAVKIEVVPLAVPQGVNLILGQSHFIKTVEDLYEALSTASPHLRFGVAFAESSGPCLIRYDGNDEELTRLATELLLRLSCGHAFLVLLREGYPINVLNRIKEVQEVVSIYCATANPVQVIVAETEQGRGILGVIDGYRSKGIEGAEQKEERHRFLRKIGYKR
jgi:adenosine/AMP kinase